MGAFAEARYFGWRRTEPDQTYPVKGRSLSADQILGSSERARPFVGGPVLLVRLAPVDYHHVHYPDDGRTLDHPGQAAAYGPSTGMHCLANQIFCLPTSVTKRPPNEKL